MNTQLQWQRVCTMFFCTGELMCSCVHAGRRIETGMDTETRSGALRYPSLGMQPTKGARPSRCVMLPTHAASFGYLLPSLHAEVDILQACNHLCPLESLAVCPSIPHRIYEHSRTSSAVVCRVLTCGMHYKHHRKEILPGICPYSIRWHVLLCTGGRAGSSRR